MSSPVRWNEDNVVPLPGRVRDAGQVSDSITVHPQRPVRRVLGVLAFMLGGYPLGLFSFITLVVLISVGIGTVVIWVGVLLLMLATQLIYGFAELERRWIKVTLGIEIPTPNTVRSGTAVQRWRQQLTDSRTWRNLGYLMISFPLCVIEFALAIAGVVLLPIAIWVLPFVATLHAALAATMLGPNTTEALT